MISLQTKWQQHVWVLIPQFGMNPTDAKDMFGKLYAELRTLKSKYQHALIDPVKLAHNIPIKIRTVQFKLPPKLSKGAAIRLAMMAVLAETDEHRGPMGRRHTWIVMVDGSGAYLKQLMVIFDALFMSSADAPVVLGKRLGEYWGMTDERKQVEFFEKCLLENHIGGELPDCQAGIWGLKTSALERISLTASNYEIEFDLALGALKAGNCEFVGVVADKDRAPSSFDKDNVWEVVDKLAFIIHCLNVQKADFTRSFAEHAARLPQFYIEHVTSRLNEEAAFHLPLFRPRR